MTTSTEYLHRLQAVSSRLGRHISEAHDGETTADAATGETWDAGQVWAHLAEFLPYWIEQANHVIDDYNGEPVPFGRTKSDERRVTAIERDRDEALGVLWNDIEDDIGHLTVFLQRLPDSAWNAVGLHPSLAEMPLARIVDEFMVGHLEEHADQLDSLRVS